MTAPTETKSFTVTRNVVALKRCQTRQIDWIFQFNTQIIFFSKIKSFYADYLIKLNVIYSLFI